MRLYTQKEVEELRLPQRGALILDLTKPQKPEIPEFLQDQVISLANVYPVHKDGQISLTSTKYHKDMKPERVIIVKGLLNDAIVCEGQVLMTEYRLISVCEGRDVTYYYVVNVMTCSFRE